MHEVGVARDVLRIALKKGAGRKIVRVRVELADDGHTTPETLSSAFSMVAKGSPAEDAELEVVRCEGLESRVVELEVEKE